MIERNGTIYSRIRNEFVQVPGRQSVNHHEFSLENSSITDYVLKLKGFKSLEQAVSTARNGKRQMPMIVARNLVLVDTVDANLETKQKLLAYRLWEPKGNFDLAREYLPKEVTKRNRLENLIHEVMVDEGELGRLYNYITKIDETIVKLFTVEGNIKIERYKLIADSIKVLIDKNLISDDRLESLTLLLNLISSKKDEIARSLQRTLREKIRSEKNKEPKESAKLQEDPRLKIVERLYKEGLSEEEIARQTGYTKSQITHCLSALRVDGRIELNSLNYKKTLKLRDLVLRVEGIINKSKEERPSYEEIASKTDSTEGRVSYAMHTLILLGRISPVGHSIPSRRRWGTDINEEKIRQVLREFKKKYPGRRISMVELKALAQVFVKEETVGKYYKKIKRKEGVPPTKVGSLRRAKRILREHGRIYPKILIIFTELSKTYGISEKTFSLAQKELEDRGAALLSRSNLRNRAKERLREYVSMNPNLPINFTELSINTGIDRHVYSRAQKELKDEGIMLITLKDYFEQKKQQFLKRLREHRLNQPNTSVNISDFARDLTIKLGTARKWYWEFIQTEEMQED